jgi:hypothetical protein
VSIKRWLGSSETAAFPVFDNGIPAFTRGDVQYTVEVSLIRRLRVKA